MMVCGRDVGGWADYLLSCSSKISLASFSEILSLEAISPMSAFLRRRRNRKLGKRMSMDAQEDQNSTRIMAAPTMGVVMVESMRRSRPMKTKREQPYTASLAMVSLPSSE